MFRWKRRFSFFGTLLNFSSSSCYSFCDSEVLRKGPLSDQAYCMSLSSFNAYSLVASWDSTGHFQGTTIWVHHTSILQIVSRALCRAIYMFISINYYWPDEGENEWMHTSHMCSVDLFAVLVRVRRRKRTSIRERFILRNWLIWFRGLTKKNCRAGRQAGKSDRVSVF